MGRKNIHVINGDSIAFEGTGGDTTDFITNEKSFNFLKPILVGGVPIGTTSDEGGFHFTNGSNVGSHAGFWFDGEHVRLNDTTEFRLGVGGETRLFSDTNGCTLTSSEDVVIHSDNLVRLQSPVRCTGGFELENVYLFNVRKDKFNLHHDTTENISVIESTDDLSLFSNQDIYLVTNNVRLDGTFHMSSNLSIDSDTIAVALGNLNLTSPSEIVATCSRFSLNGMFLDVATNSTMTVPSGDLVFDNTGRGIQYIGDTHTFGTNGEIAFYTGGGSYNNLESFDRDLLVNAGQHEIEFQTNSSGNVVRFENDGVSLLEGKRLSLGGDYELRKTGGKARIDTDGTLQLGSKYIEFGENAELTLFSPTTSEVKFTTGWTTLRNLVFEAPNRSIYLEGLNTFVNTKLYVNSTLRVDKTDGNPHHILSAADGLDIEAQGGALSCIGDGVDIQSNSGGIYIVNQDNSAITIESNGGDVMVNSPLHTDEINLGVDAVMQSTSSTTNVTTTKRAGRIYMQNLGLAAGDFLYFTMFNSHISNTSNSVILLTPVTGNDVVAQVTLIGEGSCAIKVHNYGNSPTAGVCHLHYLIINERTV